MVALEELAVQDEIAATGATYQLFLSRQLVLLPQATSALELTILEKLRSHTSRAVASSVLSRPKKKEDSEGDTQRFNLVIRKLRRDMMSSQLMLMVGQAAKGTVAPENVVEKEARSNRLIRLSSNLFRD